MSLSGKTCIVTGGAGGLGKTIAVSLLETGANVVICDINDEQLAAASEELSILGPVHAVKCNVASEESVIQLFASVIEKFGSVDTLVNNAGIVDKFAGAGECDSKLWQRVIDVNLTGPFMTTKSAVQHFKETKKGGSIINIGSVASGKGAAAGCAYTASKHGVIGLTKNTAAFYGEFGIRCNAIMPGGMATNIKLDAENMPEAFGLNKVMKTMGVTATENIMVDTKKVAKLCVFLAGDDSDIVNGASIHADKGWSSF